MFALRIFLSLMVMVGLRSATEDRFCQQLLQQTIAEGENAFLSPASAAMALKILQAGAAGTTQKELERIVPTIALDTTEQLKVASALWIDQKLEVLPTFLAANKNAEVYNEPIRVERVNQWASDKTNGKITQILANPLPPILMAITNALYFKADWAEPFLARNTYEEVFNGKTAKRPVEMMHQTAHFPYLETKRIQAIRMYYMGGYCMDVILPKKGVSLEDGSKAAYSLGFKGEKKVELALPKVKFSYEKLLNDHLKAIGLKSMFSAKADFSRISSTPLYVDFIKQNTYLSIDEAGTEAAAVTTIGLAKMVYRPEKEEVYTMTVNHPFILFIRETSTNRVLFYGVIQDIQE